MKYILVKDNERIEVIIGREDKRDLLIRAGYEWENKSEFVEIPIIETTQPGDKARTFAPVKKPKPKPYDDKAIETKQEDS